MQRLSFLSPLLLALTACSFVDLPEAELDADEEMAADDASSPDGAVHDSGVDDETSTSNNPSETTPCESAPADADDDGVCDALDRCAGDFDMPPLNAGEAYRCIRTLAISGTHSRMLSTTLYDFDAEGANQENFGNIAHGPLDSTLDIMTTRFPYAGGFYVSSHHAMLSADTGVSTQMFSQNTLSDADVRLKLNLLDGHVLRHELHVYGANASSGGLDLPAFGEQINEGSYEKTQNHLGALGEDPSNPDVYSVRLDNAHVNLTGYTQVRVSAYLSLESAIATPEFDAYKSSFHGPESTDVTKQPRLEITYTAQLP